MRTSKPKQIELNWAISGNDLDIKMKQMREFVEKGKKVELLLASKKRQRRASPEEANGTVETIRKAVADIPGCKEMKPLEGKIGGQAIMFVQVVERGGSGAKTPNVVEKVEGAG